MYALADCNNFFASCERVFRPELNGKPVIVLSNKLRIYKIFWLIRKEF